MAVLALVCFKGVRLVAQGHITPIHYYYGVPTLSRPVRAGTLTASSGWPAASQGFAQVLAAQLAALTRFSLPPPVFSPLGNATGAPVTAGLALSPWNIPGVWGLMAQARIPQPTWVRPGAVALEETQATSGSSVGLLGSPRSFATVQDSIAPPTFPSVGFPPEGEGQRVEASDGPLPLEAFPRPPADNGRGMHWIPTLRSSPAVVDRFVRELVDMNVKWVVFLNDGANIGDNDYLVRQLVAHGIEPVMRVYTNGLEPISGDLGAMVRHYTGLGVHYFQLYNEPNVAAENGGAAPDVNRYLDLWLPAAKVVVANGGLPGFGALSPGGDVDDRTFLRDALLAIRARGETAVLDRAWLSSHNYAGERPLSDPDGFLRFRQYDAIIRSVLGRPMPIIGTEGGSYTVGPVDQAKQIEQVLGAYRYMLQREPYNFAYTYWIIANRAGGGHDPAWEWQALFRPDWTSPLVEALKQFAQAYA